MFNTKQEHAISFTGNAKEYFSIWIVNLFLSIITLGIYSAWAKVRRKKYFYNNMKIDGVGFDYHAKPTSILKGRVIAFVFFLLYSFLASINIALGKICGLLLFFAIPWIVVRGYTFNARNSSHRGLRFNFSGSFNESIRLFVGLPMLLPLTLGLIYPYISFRRSGFVTNNHQFGITPFELKVTSKEFYKVYFKALGVVILVAALIGFFSFELIGKNIHLRDYQNVMLGIIFYALVGFSMMAYLQARLGNLIWNNTTIDNISFASSLRARDMIGLYLTNMLVIMLSFGLMTPWAHIRMLKYRASRLVLLGDVDFDHFVANKKEELKATGEEIADMFDVDLAFG